MGVLFKLLINFQIYCQNSSPAISELFIVTSVSICVIKVWPGLTMMKGKLNVCSLMKYYAMKTSKYKFRDWLGDEFGDNSKFMASATRMPQCTGGKVKGTRIKGGDVTGAGSEDPPNRGSCLAAGDKYRL